MSPRPNQQNESTVISQAMTLYAQGDERSFLLVYQAMAPRLYAFVWREMRNRADAEDLVQQTFLQVHHARSHYLPGTDVSPWFFSIARHLLIDWRRRRRPTTSISADYEEGRAPPSELINNTGADEQLYSKQLGALLDDKLRGVSEKHRVAFRLVKLDGFSHAEVAQKMGTTSAALKVRIHRIRRMLLEGSMALALSPSGRLLGDVEQGHRHACETFFVTKFRAVRTRPDRPTERP